MRKSLGILVLACVLAWSAEGAAKKKVKPKKIESKPQVVVHALPAAPVPEPFYRYRFNSFIGMSIVRNSGLVSGFQMGYGPWRYRPVYIGPELSFSLFSPGSILNTLAGAWWDIRETSLSRFGITVGALVGPVFTNGLSDFNTVVLGSYLEATVSQQVTDYVTVRGQLRPGLVGHQFAFMMDFSLAFRFL